MGSFYTNVTLRGPAQEEVLAHLGERTAYVSRTSDGFTVVLDEASELQDLDDLLGVTASLSAQFECPALAALNHDESVLYLSLFEHGKQVDQYNSCPDFDNEDAGEESGGPAGGDAARWVAAFGGDAAALERALRDTGFSVATERHGAVVAALGMPGFAVGTGYNHVEADDAAPQAADAGFVHTGARDEQEADAECPPESAPGIGQNNATAMARRVSQKPSSKAAFVPEEFKLRFRDLLCEDVSRLYELELDMMKGDIAQGWRYFYAEEVWLDKHLPPPLVNEAGKAVNLENLRRIVRNGKHISRVQPDPQGYRNYLDIGSLDLGGGSVGDRAPNDLVANEVATRLLHDEHRFMPREIARDREQWYAEAAAFGTLTPSPLCIELDLEPPIRNESVPLHADVPYWNAVYPKTHYVLMDTENYHCRTKPDWVVGLMTQLAADFPYDPKRGTRKSLFFTRPDERDVQWAVWIDKTDGSTTYRYPPRLALIRWSEKKLGPNDILYIHHGLKQYVDPDMNPRDIEIELRFHLPRIRKQIAFLDPFVDAALD